VCRHAECRGAVLTECIEFPLENIQIRNRMGDGKIRQFFVNHVNEPEKGNISPGNTKGGSITVLLTSCLTGLESAV
jgi:hypothetical protein